MMKGYAGNGNGNGPIEDMNVIRYESLITPYQLKENVPLTDSAQKTVREGRRAIKAILGGDDRIFIVHGPCSIHNVEEGMEYAHRVNELQKRVNERLVLVMRAYVEKPRTTVGWKGLIYEPRLDGQQDFNHGLYVARTFLRDVAEMGIPTGTEFLDPFVPQYTSDTVSWGAIGARTIESPKHREMASGFSMPLGLKNPRDGDIADAVNAAVTVRYGQVFLGIDPMGVPSVVYSKGNPNARILLRGGKDGPNYHRESVEEAQAMLREAKLDDRLMIDCSHGNSNKDHRQQPVVFEDVIGQIVGGNKGIIGLMLESNIREGNQKIPKDLSQLMYGVSVTDACIGWEETEKLILEAYKALQKKAA